MKRIYEVISKEVFESLPLDKQSGIFRLFYPELVAELRMEYLKENKKDLKESENEFLDEVGIKKNSKEKENYDSDDFLDDMKGGAD